jgi:hypothetical protein
MTFELIFVDFKDAIQNGFKTGETLGFEFLMLSFFKSVSKITSKRTACHKSCIRESVNR